VRKDVASSEGTAGVVTDAGTAADASVDVAAIPAVGADADTGVVVLPVLIGLALGNADTFAAQ
jgi:hypothetical protein